MGLYHPHDGSIDDWHILISGFRQSRLTMNGMERLWLDLRGMSSRRRCVQYFTWDDDWKEHAAFIARNSHEGSKVYIYAYSWGAGWGFMKLSKYLGELGVQVNVAVLCDPVYRNPIFPTWFTLNPMSMTEGRKIKLPDNVREVYWLYQRNNKPCGHTPVGEHCMIHDPIKLNLIHSEMEDSPEFHAMVHGVVKASVGGA